MLRPSAEMLGAELPKTIAIETLVPDAVDRFPWGGHMGLPLLPKVAERLDAARSTAIPLSVTEAAQRAVLAAMQVEPELLERVRDRDLCQSAFDKYRAYLASLPPEKAPAPRKAVQAAHISQGKFGRGLLPCPGCRTHPTPARPSRDGQAAVKGAAPSRTGGN